MPETGPAQSASQDAPLCTGSYSPYILAAVTKRNHDGDAIRATCPECDKAVAINKVNGILRAHRG